MKNISEYINEARKSTPVEIEYTPKDRDELIVAIREVAKAQSRRKVLDFNCIDTSAVDNMCRVFPLALKSLPSQRKKDFMCGLWDVSNVMTFEGCFTGCEGFTGAGLADWKVSEKCGYTGYMFESCASLRSLDMGRWKLDSVSKANAMFARCGNLTSVVFPESMAGLRDVGALFYETPKMEYIALPKNLSNNIRYYDEMFCFCGARDCLEIENLPDIAIAEYDKVGISNMFKGCGLRSNELKGYLERIDASQDKAMELGINIEKL